MHLYLFLQGRERATSNRPRREPEKGRSQLVEPSAKAKTLALKVDELGTYHILPPLVPGAKV